MDFGRRLNHFRIKIGLSARVVAKGNHRLGALDEVRRTVEENSKGKKYELRLMDYNKDPTTSFADVKRVLASTAQRLEVHSQSLKVLA